MADAYVMIPKTADAFTREFGMAAGFVKSMKRPFYEGPVLFIEMSDIQYIIRRCGDIQVNVEQQGLGAIVYPK